jgi:signal transduction histidine kinase
MASSTKNPCDLNALLNEALVLARHRLAGDPASEVVVHSELEPLPRISGEPDRLMQALFHIVTNALEATADDGEVWIRTRAQSSPAGAILEVENSGTTIPAADRDRIFTPFYTTKAAGPGLGLAVARQIMDQHRGGITVSGARGRTTFTLTFPARCGDATSPHGVATSEMGARV